MIAINVSVATCQLPIRQFSSFGKRCVVSNTLPATPSPAAPVLCGVA